MILSKNIKFLRIDYFVYGSSMVTYTCHVFGESRAVYHVIRVFVELPMSRRVSGKNREKSGGKSGKFL